MKKKDEIVLKLTKRTFQQINEDNNIVSIFELMFENISVFYNQTNNYYEIKIMYLNENVFDIYRFLYAIYCYSPKENNIVVFHNKGYDITNSRFHKLLFYKYDGMKNHGFKSFITMHGIVQENEITNLRDLVKRFDEPFSGIYKFDELDYFFTIGLGKKWELTDPIDGEYLDDVCITNRYIKNNIRFKKCKEVVFNKCFIEGDIDLQSIKTIKFWNCIIIGKITCTDVCNIKITESNVKHAKIYNSNINGLFLYLNKINRFELHNSSIKSSEMFRNKIIEPYFGNLSWEGGRIDVKQITQKNVRPSVIRKSKKRINDKFYLSFQLYEEKNIAVSTNEILLDTINLLLENGDFKNDHRIYGDLKYKKILYSNVGLKRFFVFLSGGFYKPIRWVIYLLIITIISSIIYTLPFSVFQSQVDGTLKNFDVITSIHYSILQVIGTNTTGYNPHGFSQIVSTIQSALNTAIIANFFATIIKKYIDK